MKRYYRTDEDNAVAVWDGSNGECVQTFPLFGPVENPVPLPSASDQADRLLDALNDGGNDAQVSNLFLHGGGRVKITSVLRRHMDGGVLVNMEFVTSALAFIGVSDADRADISGWLEAGMKGPRPACFARGMW